MLHGARFTPKRAFNTLYLASDVTTALLEVGAVFAPPGAPLLSSRRNPLTLTQVEGALSAVLDLTDSAVQAAPATSDHELTGAWRTLPSPPTHILATAAHASGRILAIRSPSSKYRGIGTITAVFTDLLTGFRPSFLEVVDSTGRLAQRLP